MDVALAWLCGLAAGISGVKLYQLWRGRGPWS